MYFPFAELRTVGSIFGLAHQPSLSTCLGPYSAETKEEKENTIQEISASVTFLFTK